jgi:hypothetical protein
MVSAVDFDALEQLAVKEPQKATTSYQAIISDGNNCVMMLFSIF